MWAGQTKKGHLIIWKIMKKNLKDVSTCSYPLFRLHYASPFRGATDLAEARHRLPLHCPTGQPETPGVGLVSLGKWCLSKGGAGEAT